MRRLQLLDQNKLIALQRQQRRPCEPRFKVCGLASLWDPRKINYLESQLPYLKECQPKTFNWIR